jgi:hypothetical protein
VSIEEIHAVCERHRYRHRDVKERERRGARKGWEAVGPMEKVMGGGGAQDRVPWTGSCVVELAGTVEVR